jgi:hypothetical protein
MEDNSWDQEAAALKCWEQAVDHVEKSEAILAQLTELYNDAMEVIEYHKMMAGVLLATGGFGNDPEAYAELGLYYDEAEEDDIDD